VTAEDRQERGQREGMTRSKGPQVTGQPGKESLIFFGFYLSSLRNI